MSGMFIGNRDGETTTCPNCGAEYYASREFHTCENKRKSGPKKGAKTANETIAAELHYQAKTIMEHALQQCHDLGVKVYFEDPPGYGSPGCRQEIVDADYSLDFVVDVRREKARRKLCENTPNAWN